MYRLNISAKRFGRMVFSFYDRYPLLSNTLVGGSVYMLSEVIIQMQYIIKSSEQSIVGLYNSFFRKIDWKKVTHLGMLGSAENGILMTTWYNILSRVFGIGVATEIVLAKCFCDQVFFATQQDLLFLGLCAYDDSDRFQEAVELVKKEFLNTWMVDCSIWPLVNFIGFSYIPVKFMPTYMAVVSFFWQLYISSIASNPTDVNAANISAVKDKIDDEVEEAFKLIDVDGSGSIDSAEIVKAFSNRGKELSKGELQNIMKTIDSDNNGEISLDEFKTAVTSGVVKDTKLWNLVREDMKVSKGGAKVAIQRLQEYKSKTTNVKEEKSPNIVINIEKEKRHNAITAASVGGSCLLISALFRKIVLKI